MCDCNNNNTNTSTTGCGCGCGCSEQQVPNICNQCNQTPVDCECPVKDLKSDCVIFTEDLNCLGIEGGQTLTETIIQIDEGICNKISDLQSRLSLVNVGTGQFIYKGLDTFGRKEIKSITKTGDYILLTGNTNDINISFDENKLNEFITGGAKSYSVSSTGTGIDILNGQTVTTNNTDFKFKKLNTTNLKLTNGQEITIDIDVVDSGTGTAVFNGYDLTNKKVKISTLKSNTLNISKDPDGTININAPDFSGVKTFYVNSNYVPTVQFPSNGSVSRPYITFDDAYNAVIGTGTVASPQYAYATIIIQTNVTTALNPTINTVNIKGENNIIFIYTGTDPYMFDTEVIYPLIPKITPRNNLTAPILIKVTGNMLLTRTGGIGLVRGLGSNRNGLGQPTDYDSMVIIGDINSTLYFKEREGYPTSIWDGDLTNETGVLLQTIYGTPHKYSLQLNPTTPLFYTKYKGTTSYSGGLQVMGKCTIENLANTSVKIEGDGTYLFAPEGIVSFRMNGRYVSTSSSSKIVDFPSYYQPKANTNFIECDYGKMYCKTILIDDSAGYQTTGVDNFFKITNDGAFEYGTMNLSCPYYVNKFINVNDVSNTVNSFNLTNNLLDSKIAVIAGRYLLDTTFSTFTLNMPKTIILPFLNKATNSVNITPITQCTLSSFFGTPVISGIGTYANDSAAQLAGLITNSLYLNQSTGNLTTL
jgi:hypothetical protein